MHGRHRSAAAAPASQPTAVCNWPGLLPPSHHNLDDHAGGGVVADAGAVQLRAVPVLELDRVAADLVAAAARWEPVRVRQGCALSSLAWFA